MRRTGRSSMTRLSPLRHVVQLRSSKPGVMWEGRAFGPLGTPPPAGSAQKSQGTRTARIKWQNQCSWSPSALRIIRGMAGGQGHMSGLVKDHTAGLGKLKAQSTQLMGRWKTWTRACSCSWDRVKNNIGFVASSVTPLPSPAPNNS